MDPRDVVRPLVLLVVAVSLLPAQDLERILIDHHRTIAMRDGVTLYADVYRPEREGRYPVIVSRTPYGVQRENVGVHDRLIQLAKMGYAVVNTDVRGRYESDGQWDPFRAEGKDGYDVVEWAAKQPWSSGKVGIYGCSNTGDAAMHALTVRPPALKAAFAGCFSWHKYDAFRRGGIFAQWGAGPNRTVEQDLHRWCRDRPK